MIHSSSIFKGIVGVVFVMLSFNSFAQQDPQYTHYMYNTMSVNPAYAGQRETFSVVGLNRSQWVGIEGAPQTQSLALHSPLRNNSIGLGLNIVNDALGPATETFIDGNFAYTVRLDENFTKLSFGLKAGVQLLDTDWSKGRFRNPDVAFNENVNLTSLIFGGGLYLHSRKWYLGVSVPNFLTTKHYDDFQESLATESTHFFLIGGYVFNLSNTTKLKPAFLVKGVSGAPLIADISANMLFNEKVTVGLAWRWDDSISGMAGFQVTEGMYIGYGYDLTTTDLNNYNSGTHEIILRFEFKNYGKLLSPRFF